MPHLETAALGVWVGAGSRHERAGEHGLSHLLEHMAFKGTRRRTRARHRRRDRERRRRSQRRDQHRAHRLLRPCAAPRTRRSRIDILADIVTDSIFDLDELEREKGVILQEIGAVEDTPDDLVFDLFNASAFPDQPIGRPILGTPEQSPRFEPGSRSAPISTAITARRRRCSARPARSITSASATRSSGAFARSPPDGANGSEPAGALSWRRTAAEAPARTDPCRHRLRGSLLRRPAISTRAGFRQRGRRRHVLAAVPGGARNARPRLPIHAFHWGYSDTGLFGFYAATGARDLRAAGAGRARLPRPRRRRI